MCVNLVGSLYFGFNNSAMYIILSISTPGSNCMFTALHPVLYSAQLSRVTHYFNFKVYKVVITRAVCEQVIAAQEINDSLMHIACYHGESGFI